MLIGLIASRIEERLPVPVLLVRRAGARVHVDHVVPTKANICEALMPIQFASRNLAQRHVANAIVACSSPIVDPLIAVPPRISNSPIKKPSMVRLSVPLSLKTRSLFPFDIQFKGKSNVGCNDMTLHYVYLSATNVEVPRCRKYVS